MQESEARRARLKAVPDDSGSSNVARRVEDVLAGVPQAIAWLYDTFAPGLYRRLRRRYGYPGGAEPEDLLQDAFVFYLQHDAKVLRDFATRNPPRRQTASILERHLWDLACGIASNRRRSARRADVVPITGDRPSPAPGAERQTLDRDLLRRLADCLRRGNARIFLYFTLRYSDGHSPAEIAAATGWSKKATFKLKQKLGDALRRCNQQLGASGA
ncbi:MAG: hypothetical protein AAF657_35270 [Acidobacteriota bacterium]